MNLDIRISGHQEEGNQGIRTSGSNPLLIFCYPDVHNLITCYANNHKTIN